MGEEARLPDRTLQEMYIEGQKRIRDLQRTIAQLERERDDLRKRKETYMANTSREIKEMVITLHTFRLPVPEHLKFYLPKEDSDA